VPLGPVIVGHTGAEVTAEDRELLSHPNVGGILLAPSCTADRQRLGALVERVRELREPRLLVACQARPGPAAAGAGPFSPMPAPAVLGHRFDADARQALREAQQLGWLMAGERLALGIDVVLAPRLAVESARGDGVPTGDAAHADPDSVGRLGVAFMRGMQRAGMAAIAPDFPCGWMPRSWQRQPRDRDLIDVLHHETIPFARLAHRGLAGITTAATIYPGIDPRPIAYAPRWLDAVLRYELAFTGAAMSHDVADDLVAGATALDCAGRALQAGCDMVVVSGSRRAAEVVEGLPFRDRPVSRARQLRLHGRPAGSVRQPQRAADLWRRARATASALAANTLDLEPPA